MGVVYKAENKVNGKIYIGFDANWPRRKGQHLRKAEYVDKQYFHNAIAKYGEENFEWTILKENATYDDEVNFINEYQSHYSSGKGYNLTFGGEGKLGYVTPPETKRKISEAHKKLEVTEERLKTLQENAKKMKGVKRPRELVERIANSLRGKKRTPEQIEKFQNRDKSFYQSEEYKEKMKKSLSGKKRTPEQIENIRKGALNRKKKEN
jgi:group I intron endonuclease